MVFWDGGWGVLFLYPFPRCPCLRARNSIINVVKVVIKSMPNKAREALELRLLRH